MQAPKKVTFPFQSRQKIVIFLTFCHKKSLPQNFDHNIQNIKTKDNLFSILVKWLDWDFGAIGGCFIGSAGNIYM